MTKMQPTQLQNLFNYLENVITWRVNHPEEDFSAVPEFNP